MTQLYRLFVVLFVSLTLFGCSAYSGLINTLGPERQRSDLRELVEKPVVLTEGDSPFCQLPSETYMVMPEEGKVGTVVVTFADGSEEVLQGDYQAMTLRGNNAQPFVGNDELVKDLFGEAVTALPLAPYHAKLYFLLDKDQLTPESKVEAQAIYDEILRREIAEIIIVGHTDTAASQGYNIKLSERRAMKVRQNLIEMGVDPSIIKTYGMGENELLVPTPDNTPKPENRRVEIDVR